MLLKLKQITLSTLAALLILAGCSTGVVSAANAPEQGGGGSSSTANQSFTDPAASSKKCSKDLSKCNLFTEYINPAIGFLVALMAVGAAISLGIGGVQYAQAGADPAKVTAAKSRIRNTLIALITFFFLYGLLNFLLPGGLL